MYRDDDREGRIGPPGSGCVFALLFVVIGFFAIIGLIDVIKYIKEVI